MIRLRPIRTIAEYHACERLQQEVWQFVDREIIPSNELVTIAHNGGCVIGAFEGARLLGFCFGFPAIRGRETYHCSRMLAVRPNLRDRGLGFRLKCAQRTFVLRQGLRRIRWTFDPLQARNAFFNIEKLGCTVRDYSVDHYGPSTAVFNRGLPTDRVMADWEIGSARVKSALRKAGRRSMSDGFPPAGAAALLITRKPAHGLRRPVRVCPLPRGAGGDARATRSECGAEAPHVGQASVCPARAGSLVCEIPSDVESLQRSHLPVARLWRHAVRRALLEAFRRGFAITGVARWREGDERRCAYILDRASRPAQAEKSVPPLSLSNAPTVSAVRAERKVPQPRVGRRTCPPSAWRRRP